MFVVGLTGGIGSGKSTVAELFHQHGIEIVDADLIARQVVEPGDPALSAIENHFGEDILDNHGALRRQALRELVFENPAEREWLEQLLHPLINDAIRKRINDCSTPYCILMSPLLLETSQMQLVNRILVVDVTRETQLERTLQRDGSSRETIEAIIDVQVARQTRLKAADDIISNGGDISDLDYDVSRLHDSYLSLAIGQ